MNPGEFAPVRGFMPEQECVHTKRQRRLSNLGFKDSKVRDRMIPAR